MQVEGRNCMYLKVESKYSERLPNLVIGEQIGKMSVLSQNVTFNIQWQSSNFKSFNYSPHLMVMWTWTSIYVLTSTSPQSESQAPPARR